jgi:DNA-binding NarL/FixJ family response regulator
MYKVCLVEDDPASRELLVLATQDCRKLKLVSAYETGKKALKELPKIKPDVILMDIKLPGMNGIECLVALRKLSPLSKSRVLMLTEHEDADLIFDALKAGADGYLIKRDTSGKALQAAILEVMAGGGPMSQSIARKVIGYFQTPKQGHLAIDNRQAQFATGLSARQHEVLKLATQGLTYKEMASQLNVSLDAVRKHLQGIYKKLHVHSRTDPLLYSVSRQQSHRPHP